MFSNHKMNLSEKLKNMYTPGRTILLGFLIGAILGSLLLSLPICHQEGVTLSYVDALFTSTTSICVTGLSPITIGETFNAIGQVIILILIQVGGLGIITFTALLLIMLKKRINMQTRILIQNSYNLETLSGMIKLVLRILKTTLLLESIGAIGYLFVFIPAYGAVGIWYAVFHSISAFCNAGIDLLGSDSLVQYQTHVWMNLVTMFLIITGGLGFPVHWEIWGKVKERRISKRSFFKSFSLSSKLALSITAALIVLGMLTTMILEYSNADTIGNLSFFDKLLTSLFQSVTLRTAGFATIAQGAFRDSTSIVYMVMMFIGGSPLGTAGGVKTVTFVLLLVSMICDIRGSKSVTIFHRKVSEEYVRRSVAIVAFSFSTLFVLTVLLMTVQSQPTMDILYEMTSAIATVGLSRGLTGELTVMGKLIVIVAMYLGRVGPISIAFALKSGRRASSVEYASERIILG